MGAGTESYDGVLYPMQAILPAGAQVDTIVMGDEFGVLRTKTGDLYTTGLELYAGMYPTPWSSVYTVPNENVEAPSAEAPMQSPASPPPPGFFPVPFADVPVVELVLEWPGFTFATTTPAFLRMTTSTIRGLIANKTCIGLMNVIVDVPDFGPQNKCAGPIEIRATVIYNFDDVAGANTYLNLIKTNLTTALDNWNGKIGAVLLGKPSTAKIVSLKAFPAAISDLLPRRTDVLIIPTACIDR